jgi:hypothetical protein
MEAVHQLSFAIPRKTGAITDSALTYAMLDQKHTLTPPIIRKGKNLQT